MTSISTIKRRKPVQTYRSPSASDDSTDLPTASTLQQNTKKTIIKIKPSQPSTMSLVVVDAPNTHPPSTKPMTLPRVRLVLPPHPDWYHFKPIPKPPLPLYHPNRVFKPLPPLSTSKALPLTRKISPALDVTGPRSSARNRRPPFKIREAGVTGDEVQLGSPTSSMGDEKELEEAPVRKPRRPRRKKAEMMAAAAEGEITVAPRRKRRRTGGTAAHVGEGGGGENQNTVGDVDATLPPTAATGEEEGENGEVRPQRKRRKRGTVTTVGVAESSRNENQAMTSSYGTRSRTTVQRGHQGATSSVSEEVSVIAEDEEVEDDGDDDMVTATPRKRGGGRRRPPTITTTATTPTTTTTTTKIEKEGAPEIPMVIVEEEVSATNNNGIRPITEDKERTEENAY